MNPLTTSAFDLPDRLSAKADPALIAGDEQHFAAIAESLEQSIADLSDRLDAERRAPGGIGQEAMDRDTEIHRLTARLRTLRRFGLDLCLGHMVGADDPEPVYVGRLGLTDSAGRRLLVDWRSPAAEPFFGATHANPMGLASRRRYRWTRGRISDYWDEVFTADGFEGHAALDDQSAFIASLGSNRSPRMRDVLGTIQADQDAIIRAGIPRRPRRRRRSGHGQDRRRPAPHRLPPLLRPAPRSPPGRRAVRRPAPALPGLRRRRPAQPRRGGRADLHPAGPRPRGSRGGGRDRPGRGPPEVVRGPGEGDRAGRQVLRGAAHRGHDGRDPLVRHLAERRRLGRGVRGGRTRHAAQRGARPGLGGAAHDPGGQARRRRRADEDDLLRQVAGAEPGAGSTPSTGRGRCSKRPTSSETCGRCPPTCACALPGSSPDEVRTLQRADAQAWTVSDLPLLDAARQRLGDPEASRRKRRHEAAVAAERERMAGSSTACSQTRRRRATA